MKNTLLALTVILSTFAIASCTTVPEDNKDVAPTPEPEPIEKVIPEPEPEPEPKVQKYPQKITNTDELRKFPARLAGFNRRSAYRYSADLNYVLVNYAISTKQHRIRAQVYRFPSTATLEEQFNVELKRLLGRLQDVNIQSKNSGTEVINNQFTRYKEIRYFYKSKKSGTLFGQLILQQRGKQFFRVRSSAPQSEAQTTPPKTQELLRAAR